MTSRVAPAAAIFLLAWICFGTSASAAGHSEPGGIDWYPGSVAEALAAARTAHKPVFLYWGAKWCPPCQQLKSSVFARADFIAASRQFIAVYLDGDDPGAQKWGDAFHFNGYPTVIVLSPDKRELMRLSGGLDLSQYAEVLQSALGNVAPVDEVLAAVATAKVPSVTDCQRLAYNGWGLADYSATQRKSIAQQLLRAGRRCASLDEAGKARLAIDSAALDPSAAAVTQVIAIVHDAALAPRLAAELSLLAFSNDFLKNLKARGAPTSELFKSDWIQAMDSASLNPTTLDAEQLEAVAAKLIVIKALAADQSVPQGSAADARLRVKNALDKHYPPFGRAGVVNSAEAIYDTLGDQEALLALMKSEMATSDTPYYYMLDMGELEEKRGHAEEALQWYARAYQESRGIATRYSWGRHYLEALLRLAPTEHQRIREVGIAVVGELDGPDRIHDGMRAGLQKLDAQLRKWNSSHQYDQDIAAIHARMGGVCSKIPASVPTRNSCVEFLS